MLTVRIQVIDGTGTFTLSDSQPCRLLTSLHRSYPASAVLRTSPPPQGAQPVPRGLRLVITDHAITLQPLRYPHDCSDCFRLERLPGGVRTHWKAPPCHGAHPART